MFQRSTIKGEFRNEQTHYSLTVSWMIMWATWAVWSWQLIICFSFAGSAHPLEASKVDEQLSTMQLGSLHVASLVSLLEWTALFQCMGRCAEAHEFVWFNEWKCEDHWRFLLVVAVMFMWSRHHFLDYEAISALESGLIVRSAVFHFHMILVRGHHG